MKCDVLVLGGGAAGLAAAVTASRMGAHTVLIERHGALGGMATAALVHSICGLYFLREEPGAVPAQRGQRATLAPRAIVDATGDAAFATLAGLATDRAPADRLQRPAFIFSLHTVEVAALDDTGRLRLAHQIAAAVSAGELLPGCLGAHLRATGRGSEVYVTIDLATGPDFDPCAPAQLTAMEGEGRLLAAQLTAFLRENHPAFSHSELAAFPARVGIRESRRVRGRAIVTSEDVLRGVEHSDVVALGTWPIELRERATGPRWRFPEDNRPTQIPLDALRAAAAENVWTAGRCLSCDHEAQAALRVIGTCLATGQAAGAAAALQANGNVEPTAADVRAAIDFSETPHAAECR